MVEKLFKIWMFIGFLAALSMFFVKGPIGPHFAFGVELDADANGAIDINRGGSNATSVAGIRANINVEDGAEANPDLVSQADAEAGTSETEFSWSPLRVFQAIAAYISANAGSLFTVDDAPSDGTGYVRKDGAWTPESGGSGATYTFGTGLSETDNHVINTAPNPFGSSIGASEVDADVATQAELDQKSIDDRAYADANDADTDAQDLTLTDNTLAISNDPNTDVDLSVYLDNTDAQTSSDVEMAEIGTATYDDVQNWSNNTQSAGLISGGTISDDDDGTITIAHSTGIIKSTNSDIGVNYFFDLAQDSTISLTDESINYIAVDYNSGTPTYRADVTSQANGHTIINIGKVYKEGTSIDILNSGLRIYDLSKRLQQNTLERYTLEFVSGAIVSETGTLNIAITSGVMHAGINRILSSAIDTSGINTFEYYYYDGDAGPAVWVESDEIAIDSANYNDVATGLTAIANARYGVHWVYKGDDSHTYVLYGQGSYTLVEAQSVQPPSSLPSHVEHMGALRAKIIVYKDAITFTEIQNVSDIQFSYSTASNHNELGGLQGGSANEYYHLTSAQYTIVGNTSNTNSGDNAVNTNYDESSEIQAIIGADVYQAYDADLTTYAGITPSADGQALLASADANPFTDADESNLDNQSGTNTGDETAASIEDIITGAGAETTPADAWVFTSIVSEALKKVTWANIKAGLKTYFDTLYSATSHNHGWECGFTIKSPELHTVDPTRSGIIVKLKPNTTGATVTLTQIVFTSTTDDYPFSLYESNGAYDFGTVNDSLMLSDTASTDGTAVYSFATTSFTDATIANNSVPFFAFGTAEVVEINGYIKGTYTTP